jgi:hypothetical protein
MQYIALYYIRISYSFYIRRQLQRLVHYYFPNGVTRNSAILWIGIYPASTRLPRLDSEFHSFRLAGFHPISIRISVECGLWTVMVLWPY